MADPIIVRVQAFDQEMRPDFDRLDENWMHFWTQQEHPIRIISRTQRFNLREPQQRLQTALRPLERRSRGFEPIARMVQHQWNGTRPPLEDTLATLPDELQQDFWDAIGKLDPDDKRSWKTAIDRLGKPLWRIRWYKAYDQMYDHFMSQVALRGLHHYMMVWLPDGQRPETTLAAIESTFDTAATLEDYPPFLPGSYREMPRYLEPLENIHPYITFLGAMDIKGTWDITTLHKILTLDMDVAISLDIGVFSRTRAELMADFTIANRTNQMERGGGPRDVRAQRQLQSAMELQEMLDSQALHEVRAVVAIHGQNPDELDDNEKKVLSAAGSRLQLIRVPCGQKALSRFFTTAAPHHVDARTKTRKVPSSGVSVMMPFGLRKPDRTDGILWILQGDTPIMFNPFANRRAGHAVVLGKTGSGKTFAVWCWAMRMLTQGIQIVVYEPQGHSRRLVNAAGRGGARYVLTMNQQINVLDVVVTRDGQNPPSMAEQVDHVIAQLGVLMGSTVATGEGTSVFKGREWTNTERGCISMALGDLYTPFDLETLEPKDTPILSNLIEALRNIADHGPNISVRDTAAKVADEIEVTLILGPYGSTFNARTNIDWKFHHDVTAYDFSQIPEGTMRMFFYGQSFSSLNRYVRSPIRDRRKTLVAIIDEFNYMAQVPSLRTFAALASKTWRTFGAHLWTMDQDAHTYIGTEGGSADASMLSTFQNTPLKIILKQDLDAAERLGTVIEGLRPAHVRRISQQQQGECVIVWESDSQSSLTNEVFVGYMYPNDDEWRAFTGT